MLNILNEPLIGYRPPAGGIVNASLPEVFEALLDDRVESFPALRPHQRHAWHAFLVQLGAMAMQRAGLDAPPTGAGEWQRIIRALTLDWPDDEPWQLVVDDIAKPAFMQPPATSGERDYKSAVATPDELDMLVTSKNHDLKSAVAERTGIDDWIFALITLQTMEGFGGAGNYGISRMNGGLGNRPAFSLALRSQSPGPHVQRDIKALLELMPAISDQFPSASGGYGLLWTLPWDGNAAEALLLNQLHPLYIEICRRIRLKTDRNGKLSGIRANSKASRISSKEFNGRTGDPWALIDLKGEKVLTLSSGGFHYKRVTEYLTSGDFEASPLLRPTASEQRSQSPMQLVARAMVRGQGKTEGYYERTIPIGHKLSSAMLRRNTAERDDLGVIAKERMDDIGRVQRILSHAIQVFAARGDRDRITSEHRERARPWLNRLDAIIDANFFDDLQMEFEAVDGEERDNIRSRWLLDDENRSGVINNARSLLADASGSLPCPSIRRPKAQVMAEDEFWRRIRGPNGLPKLFQSERTESADD